jgi:hypothetical protein
LIGAYDQIRKNALQIRDDSVIEDALVQSIRRALVLDPNDTATRQHLEALTGQLAWLKAQHKTQ